MSVASANFGSWCRIGVDTNYNRRIPGILLLPNTVTQKKRRKISNLHTISDLITYIDTESIFIYRLESLVTVIIVTFMCTGRRSSEYVVKITGF